MNDRAYNILIIRFSSLGDIILSSSMWESLKATWGDKIKIHLLTSKEFSGLLEDHPNIDRLYSFDRKKNGLKGLWELLRVIQDEVLIDLIIDMHGSMRSLFARMILWKIPRVFVDKRTFERCLLTWFKKDFF